MTAISKTTIETGIPFFPEESESPEAWAACLTYVNLPSSKRNLTTVSRIIKGDVDSVKMSSVTQWSSRFNWQQRAVTWDTYKAKIYLDDQRKGWIKTQEDFNKTAVVLNNLNLKLLKAYQGWVTTNIDNIPSDKLDIDTIQQAVHIQNDLLKCDRNLWSRYLTSVGIEGLLENIE